MSNEKSKEADRTENPYLTKLLREAKNKNLNSISNIPRVQARKSTRERVTQNIQTHQEMFASHLSSFKASQKAAAEASEEPPKAKEPSETSSEIIEPIEEVCNVTQCSKTSHVSNALPCGHLICNSCQTSPTVMCKSCSKLFTKPLFFTQDLQGQHFYDFNIPVFLSKLHAWTCKALPMLYPQSGLSNFVGLLASKEYHEIMSKVEALILQKKEIVNLVEFMANLDVCRRDIQSDIAAESLFNDRMFQRFHLYLSDLTLAVANPSTIERFFVHVHRMTALNRLILLIEMNVQFSLKLTPVDDVNVKAEVSCLKLYERFNNKLTNMVFSAFIQEGFIDDICFAEDGRLLVASSHTLSILCAHNQGHFLESIHVGNIRDDVLRYMSAIIVFKDKIYITSKMNANIYTIGPSDVQNEFKVVAFYGRIHLSNVEFQESCAMTYNNEFIYVCDTANCKVLVFDADLHLCKVIKLQTKPYSAEIVNNTLGICSDTGVLFMDLRKNVIIAQDDAVHGRINAIDEYFYVTAHKPYKAFFIYDSKGKQIKSVLYEHYLSFNEDYIDGRMVFSRINHTVFLMSNKTRILYRF